MRDPSTRRLVWAVQLANTAADLLMLCNRVRGLASQLKEDGLKDKAREVYDQLEHVYSECARVYGECVKEVDDGAES